MDLPYVEAVGCPHCLSGRLADDCCVCHGTGTLRSMTRLVQAVANIWARPGCLCQTCQVVGPGPRGER